MVENASWQRWTIDEIVDEVARVLVCERLVPPDETLLELLAPVQGDVRPRAADVRALLMAVELGAAEDTWTEERAVFMPLEELDRQLATRLVPGVPRARDRRPREGDVFWVVPGAAASAERGADEAVEAAQDLAGSAILDATAAARQATKRTYHRAAQLLDPEHR